MALFFDVLLDDFIGDVAATHAKVAARPHVASPELLSQVRELMHHFVRGLPFQHLEKTTNRQTRRHTHEQMNVVTCYMSFHDCNFVSAADFADQLSETGSNFTTHDRLTVLCDPNQMQVDAKNGVCTMSVVCHDDRLYHAPENLLKSSPKGEGFNPPRWGQ